MSHFFISYSRRDLEIVDKYVHALAEMGMNAWVDREDIKVGNSWRVQIVEAIDTCDAFVFFLSSNSAASANVHKEVILAQDSGRPTYVVMLEVVRLPAAIRYQLAGLQFINAPLLGFEKSAQILIDALKPHLKKRRIKNPSSKLNWLFRASTSPPSIRKNKNNFWLSSPISPTPIPHSSASPI